MNISQFPGSLSDTQQLHDGHLVSWSPLNDYPAIIFNALVEFDVHGDGHYFGVSEGIEALVFITCDSHNSIGLTLSETAQHTPGLTDTLSEALKEGVQRFEDYQAYIRLAPDQAEALREKLSAPPKVSANMQC